MRKLQRLRSPQLLKEHTSAEVSKMGKQSHITTKKLKKEVILTDDKVDEEKVTYLESQGCSDDQI